MSKPMFRSFQEFEAALKQETVPYPRVESIRERLQENESRRPRRWLKPLPVTIGLLCIAAILFTAGPTVQALFAKYVLHDSNGEPVLEYVQTSQEWIDKGEKVRSIMYDWKGKMNEIQENLNDGDAVIFLVPEAYAVAGHYFPLQKPDLYHRIEDMIRDTSNGFIAPPYIPENYYFSKGLIGYSLEPIEHETIDQWYRDAVAADQPYIIKPVALTDQPQSIFFVFEDERNPIAPYFTVSLSEATGFTSTTKMADSTEIIEVAHSEVLYEDDEIDIVTFVVPHNGINLQYSIHGNSLMTKEELLRIAEGIIAESASLAPAAQ